MQAKRCELIVAAMSLVVVASLAAGCSRPAPVGGAASPAPPAPPASPAPSRPGPGPVPTSVDPRKDAAARYVAVTGDDANPGTVDRPLRTLQRAADMAAPGTVVWVGPGTYRPVVTRHSGTAKARIVYRSATPLAAKIVSGTDTTPWANRGSYVDIVGFEISAPSSREGITSEASYVRVIGNHVHHVAMSITCTNNGGAAIDHASYRSTGNEVSANRVDHIGPAGCNFVQGIYVSQSAGVIRNNIVYQVAAWGIHTWHGAT